MRGVLLLGLALLVLTAAWVVYSKSSVARRPSAPGTDSAKPAPPPRPFTMSPSQRAAAASGPAAKSIPGSGEAGNALGYQKELAWRRYFQPTAECERPPTWPDMVACANQYVGARQAFESQWKMDRASTSGPDTP